MDTEFGVSVALQPWVIGQKQPGDFDFNRSGYRRILASIYALAVTDLELASRIVSSPWFTNGLTYAEAQFLMALYTLASEDIETARIVGKFPWFTASSLDSRITNGFLSLRGGGFIVRNPELAKAAVRYWFTEVPTVTPPVFHLKKLASADVELAWRVVNPQWSQDGIGEYEHGAILGFSWLAENDIELARKASNHQVFNSEGFLALNIVRVYQGIAMDEESPLVKLVTQPWFADGLSSREAILLDPLAWSAKYLPKLYTDLVKTHYVQHKLVSLPLAGEVNIWVIQNTPFPDREPSGKALLTTIENTLRVSERIVQVPFPATDVVLLVVDNTEYDYGYTQGKHLWTFMIQDRSEHGVANISHETAHYYFGPGPQWLSEGGAEFIVAYTRHQTGVELISERLAFIDGFSKEACLKDGIENLWDLIVARGFRDHNCYYYLGEAFLLNIYEVIGEDVLSSVFRDLYWNSAALNSGSQEEVAIKILDIFVKHVPGEKLEEFLQLYRQWHGGPFFDDS